MPLSRSNRIDRRRRVMLDAVAADSEFAVDSVRAKRRLRTRENEDVESVTELTQKYRDPGYSQAVRKTCQQRMVQLIPVRRGTLSVVLTCMWLLWGGLLFAHYSIFTQSVQSVTTAGNAVGFAATPIAQLFHLRSPHSIAQWLNVQLWMLTAVAAWMIFQLRRHKLDDYRARYRIWVVLAIAAAFSSFEASTSGLMLLGISIDGWAKKEIGYAGFPLVLATFASIIGVLGIRLCSELKSAPMSVASWMFGLMAWGLAALLGNGLLKLSWTPATIDLVVGACSLGGILAVFQAAGIYLRQTYIHAQKRFLVRNGANLAPIQWKVPKLSLRRQRSDDPYDQELVETGIKSKKSRWKMPWTGRKYIAQDTSDRDVDSKRSSRQETSANIAKQRDPSARVAESNGARANDRTSDRNTERPIEKTSVRNEESVVSNKPKGRLFGFIPNRKEQNERLDADPIREDDGPMEDRGLTKKRGWFGIGGNRDRELNDSQLNDSQLNDSDAPPRPIAKPIATNKSVAKPTEQDGKDANKGSDKKSFWSRKSTAAVDKPKSTSDASPKEPAKSKRGWISKFSKSAQLAESNAANGTSQSTTTKQTTTKLTADPAEAAKPKKPWLSFT